MAEVQCEELEEWGECQAVGEYRDLTEKPTSDLRRTCCKDFPADHISGPWQWI